MLSKLPGTAEIVASDIIPARYVRVITRCTGENGCGMATSWRMPPEDAAEIFDQIVSIPGCVHCDRILGHVVSILAPVVLNLGRAA